MTQTILVLPNASRPGEWTAEFPDEASYADLDAQKRWIERSEAEQSSQFWQPIPAALVRDSEGRFCVLRRIKDTRKDIKGKLTLIFGGHIDGAPGERRPLDSLVTETLFRELEEEIGASSITAYEPLALVTDLSDTDGTRHVCFLHTVHLGAVHLRLGAPEEFSHRSKYHLSFLCPEELIAMVDQFDPWSRIAIERLIAPSGPRQERFTFG